MSQLSKTNKSTKTLVHQKANPTTLDPRSSVAVLKHLRNGSLIVPHTWQSLKSTFDTPHCVAHCAVVACLTMLQIQPLGRLSATTAVYIKAPQLSLTRPLDGGMTQSSLQYSTIKLNHPTTRLHNALLIFIIYRCISPEVKLSVYSSVLPVLVAHFHVHPSLCRNKIPILLCGVATSTVHCVTYDRLMMVRSGQTLNFIWLFT